MELALMLCLLGIILFIASFWTTTKKAPRWTLNYTMDLAYSGATLCWSAVIILIICCLSQGF